MIDVEKQIEEVMRKIHRYGDEREWATSDQDEMKCTSLALKIRDELRTLLSSAQSGEQAQAIHKGYKLVPVTPTPAQLRAGYWSGGGEIRLHEEWARKESYERMVHAAPEIPAPALEVERDAKVIESLELLENGALNIAENAKNRGDGYDEGYANAMAKMARDTLTLLGVAASQPNGEAAHG